MNEVHIRVSAERPHADLMALIMQGQNHHTDMTDTLGTARVVGYSIDGEQHQADIQLSDLSGRGTARQISVDLNLADDSHLAIVVDRETFRASIASTSSGDVYVDLAVTLVNHNRRIA